MGIENLKIVSGGQTGVDRAALDFALHFNIPCGGFCPKGRKAEDGPIPSDYPLQEMDSECYSLRTKKNIELADATVLFKTNKQFDRGSLLTRRHCIKMNKPLYIYRLNQQNSLQNENFNNWINENSINILNVAGNRESETPGIYQLTYQALRDFYLNYWV
jgi:predicted Rossmann fold nucleotide-binding protein DprA/Smf involved in DNA uptake